MRREFFIGISKVFCPGSSWCYNFGTFQNADRSLPILAANVLIHEEGRLQLCDFGVATVMDTKLDKRRTFIGTLHWMPPEMWDKEPEYSDEVRAYPNGGFTLYYHP